MNYVTEQEKFWSGSFGTGALGGWNERLCLGTVQLGMKYGINNRAGRKPSAEEAHNILQEARGMGIHYFDTAAAYGDAESIICESGILRDGAVRVITKIAAMEKNGYKAAMQQSLDSLGVEKVDGILLHRWESYCDIGHVEALLSLRDAGMADYVGVSVYEPGEALKAAEDGLVDYIQVPYNAFDQRLDKAGFFEAAKRRRIRVFARSAFLQGLLLMDGERVPGHLAQAAPYLRKMDGTLAEFGFGRAEAALLFAYCHPGIDHVVFGVDTVEQLAWNMETISRAEGFEECRSALVGVADGIDPEILNPGLWGSMAS